ncbi:MAG: hypothetical protein IKC09_02635 [Oscillospiraceae bacterium]|nr:hypothetical protein [Oscillospiraceae bacterium]
MIWLIEIPVIVFIIAGMLVGSIEIGGILRITGVIMSLAAALALVIFSNSEDRRKREDLVPVCWVVLGTGIVALIVGIYFGEHNLFEFLFGTGWF